MRYLLLILLLLVGCEKKEKTKLHVFKVTKHVVQPANNSPIMKSMDEIDFLYWYSITNSSGSTSYYTSVSNSYISNVSTLTFTPTATQPHPTENEEMTEEQNLEQEVDVEVDAETGDAETGDASEGGDATSDAGGDGDGDGGDGGDGGGGD